MTSVRILYLYSLALCGPFLLLGLVTPAHQSLGAKSSGAWSLGQALRQITRGDLCRPRCLRSLGTGDSVSVHPDAGLSGDGAAGGGADDHEMCAGLLQNVVQSSDSDSNLLEG